MKEDIKEEMTMPDIDCKETNSLAGLFQNIVEDCKVRIVRATFIITFGTTISTNTFMCSI